MDELNKGFYVTAVLVDLRSDPGHLLDAAVRQSRIPASAASSASSPRSSSSGSRSTTPAAATDRSRRSWRRPGPVRRPTSSRASRSDSRRPAPPALVDRRRAALLVLRRRSRPGRLSGRHRVHPLGRYLRHRGRHDGHADVRRLHPGHGHLRPDHRQRRRHRRDERPAGERARHDRRARLRREHHQGADQGVRHRHRRAGRVPALLRLPAGGRSLRWRGDASPGRRPRQSARLRRRLDRRRAGLRLRLAGHARRRPRRVGA